MFLYSQWMQLPLPTRQIIAKAFGIAKTGPTHVFNNQIQSDGYAIKDIEIALTTAAIQNYLNTTETDLSKLWEFLVANAEGTNIIPVGPTKVETETPSLEPKKRGRKTKA